MDESEEKFQNNCDPTKILFIDLENCPSQILQLHENLEQYSQVIICYAKTGVKIPLDWLVPLSATVVQEKLKVFKMTNVGKNSADFGICFFAGALMQKFEKKAQFTIISNDTDLDHVVHLLTSQGCTAERIGTKKEKNILDVQNNLELSPIKLYCTHLVTHSKNRPSKKETLLNSIRNKFKNKPEIAEEVFKLLTEKKAFTIVEKKVSYDDKKINIIVNST